VTFFGELDDALLHAMDKRLMVKAVILTLSRRRDMERRQQQEYSSFHYYFVYFCKVLVERCGFCSGF